MKTTRQLYCQYLLSSQINYTCTNLAEHFENLDHNSVYRYLKTEKLTPRLLWEKVKDQISYSVGGAIIFDDTVLDKSYSFAIEGVRRQYSGNEHAVIKGIGLVNCVYYNPELDRFWVLDYRIFDPERDGKSKLDHVSEMLGRASTASSRISLLSDGLVVCNSRADDQSNQREEDFLLSAEEEPASGRLRRQTALSGNRNS